MWVSVHTTTACYDAERRVERLRDIGGPVALFGTVWDPEPLIRFNDIDGIQAFCHTITSHLGVRPVAVRHRKGSRSAHYEPENSVIAIPGHDNNGNWALTDATVLHEIAHHLRSPSTDHDTEFVSTLADLFRLTGSPITATLLTATYHERTARS